MRILRTAFRGHFFVELPGNLLSFPQSRAAFCPISTALSHAEATSFSDDTEHCTASCFDERFQNILRKLSKNNPNERTSLCSGPSGLLRSCTSKGPLTEGKAIQDQLIKNGIHPSLEICSSMDSLFVKLGSFGFAGKVVDELPEQDAVLWNKLMSRLEDEGCSYDLIKFYCQMRKDGSMPNGLSLAAGLKACSISLELDFGTQLHAEVIKLGVFLDGIVGSALVDLYAKCGELELANKVFFNMPKKNAVSWNALLDGYGKIGDWKEILTLFCRLKIQGLKFSKFTLLTVLKSCAHMENLGGGQAVHALLIKIGCELDKILGSCLLNMYSKCELADDALKVFGRIKNPKIVAWSTMISCLDQQGRSLEAAEMFCQMRHTNLRPNQFTLASMVTAAKNLGDWHYGESIHACVFKYGFESDNYVSNALVTMYMKVGSVQKGWHAFNQMPVLDTASWNFLLCGIYDSENCDHGPNVFKEMLAQGFKPDTYTYISILRCCSSLLTVFFAKQVHTHIIKSGLNANRFVATVLIGMYSKGRSLDDADVILNELMERDLFTWTVLISGCAQTNQGEKAVKSFNQMQRQGVKPNNFTFSSCLSACSSSAILESGQQLHSLALKSGQSNDTYVSCALVAMYAQCRCIEDAEKIFKGLDSRNRVSWNTIICGYSQHGQGKKALEAFQIMLDEGVPPDEVTFIGVLSACSHMGLIDQGKMHFNSLSKEYGLTLSIEHCACMVNIFSRAGKFNEVERFVGEWKLTESPLIWETVLWACKMHGNVEFGERAAQKLFELEPEMGFNYILLSHIYAANGQWDDVARVRALMRSRKITKAPGCSWLEFNAQAHVFFAQDRTHPMIREIYSQLERLAR
ncbi:PREDICTED: pentatricopeptide [Prunus dulcis]|uniref:PREDICTED: pentatricopeptide n=1 Tax=Prunus dulcis TaxID=3755 RepID=A0A5E4E6R2_PRUDU|nr:PREDICTED: pentatricopeptide [Prunus dulcis]